MNETRPSQMTGATYIAFLPLTFVVLLPSLVLLPLWFVLVGRLLSREREYQQVRNDVVEKQTTT
jgi:hypothetical protein